MSEDEIVKLSRGALNRILDVLLEYLNEEIERRRALTSEQLVAVGKALLPYLRNDLSASEIGMAAHDAASALVSDKGRRQKLPSAL